MSENEPMNEFTLKEYTQEEYRADIAKAFQFGLAFGFGKKHDEMDSVIDEIKKVITLQPKMSEQESTTKNDLVVDAISRQAINGYIDYILSHGMGKKKSFEFIKKFVANLPSVTPIRPKGYWYIDERPESNREVICSNCEQPIFKYHKLDFDYRPKYCPNCGAKMVESQERSDKE